MQASTAPTPGSPETPVLWDMLVVGGGPSGSAAALRALQLRPSARVAILDAADFPRDKACGDGIAPHGLRCRRRKCWKSAMPAPPPKAATSTSPPPRP